ncbi:MAG: DHHA1 domain-containing protein, partial [Gemmatimonadota bacterium]|nr:DHHA1 domain-containing protein [Gemmatimonadota bacterium]
ESGGQVSDTGLVEGESWTMPVDDVHKEDGEQVISGEPDGGFSPSKVEAKVDTPRRRDIERNHSATHLVHAALREVLGTHVRQSGSVVSPDRLRFDFAHHQPMTDGELRDVEEQVNRAIWDNVPVQTHEMSYKEALKMGAMALFGEKYGDVVRVVDMPGVSVELCGGTHVRSTGQIGLFHFTAESGVAAGVRRIEAVTGPGAYGLMRRLETQLDEAASTLNTNPEHLEKKIEGLIEEKRRLERQVEELLKRGGGGDGGEKHTLADGTELTVGESPVDDRAQIGMLMDTFREQNKNSVSVLFTAGERPGVHVAVTDDLVARGIKAGDIVKRIAEVSGGKGGGRPHFASAGAGDPAKLPEARRQTVQIVEQILQGGVG